MVQNRFHHLATSYRHFPKLEHVFQAEFLRIEWIEPHTHTESLNEWFDSAFAHDRYLGLESVVVLKINLHPKVFFPL